jgi:glycosyltransferase involved in cell wall biosynthesis
MRKFEDPFISQSIKLHSQSLAGGQRASANPADHVPTYSIIIPVFNRVFGFREALGSALKVDGCTEIVVIDDHSTHSEFETIAASFQDTRIRYTKNENTLGLFGNWNKGISIAKGEFVSVLCSDDLIEANCFDEFLQAYRSDPTLDVFFGSFCTFTENSGKINVIKSFPAGKINPETFLTDALNQGLGFPVLTITRRSTALNTPFVEKPHSGNDWLWIYGNASKFNMYATSKPINYWRRHPDQDAERSASITTDCWPLMYTQIYEQLAKSNRRLAKKALRQAKGVILSWLLNDFDGRTNYFPRLTGAEAGTNNFLNAANKLIESDWLLSRLIKTRKGAGLFRNIGRIVRKLGYYPATFISKGTPYTFS